MIRRERPVAPAGAGRSGASSPATSSPSASAAKLRSSRCPAAPLFSGWNWTPQTFPDPTAAANRGGQSTDAAADAEPGGAAYECAK